LFEIAEEGNVIKWVSTVVFVTNTVGSPFTTVRFTTIHFYDPCRVGPSNLNLCIYCRNSSVLSLFSELLALFRCARVSSFSILVQLFQGECDFTNHDIHQNDRLSSFAKRSEKNKED
jgi:hypothetical protein